MGSNELQKKKEFEKISFKMPQINRDQQIWLGQSIIGLIGINMPSYLTESSNREDICLMIVDILEHFGITIEDLYKHHILENVLNPEYQYNIKVELGYTILSKKRL